MPSGDRPGKSSAAKEPPEPANGCFNIYVSGGGRHGATPHEPLAPNFSYGRDILPHPGGVSRRRRDGVRFGVARVVSPAPDVYLIYVTRKIKSRGGIFRGRVEIRAVFQRGKLTGWISHAVTDVVHITDTVVASCANTKK